MIPEYVNDWLTIIEQMNNDNTYKLAWGRAVIECVTFDDFDIIEDKAIIAFDKISLRMLKYYWNQLFFFKLKQSPYKDKDPIICKDTEKLIEIYKSKTNSSIPIWFDDAQKYFDKNDKATFSNTIKHISKTLHENVCWRFKNIPNKVLEIYEYNRKESTIIISMKNIKELKNYSIILSKLLNYKWAQLLEKYNFSPKIASKVNGISEAKLKRNNLKKYKEELLKEFKGKEIIDFYTGTPISENDISIDHVIPWSFMYSDDIWNLVITSKSFNSSKSNSIPSNETIEKLKIRNNNLNPLLSGSFKLAMDEAIKNNYVDKFYYESRL
ncbi:MAG: HNH endonuclease domain-containing protein [Anaeroplasmataceae bacterium]